jgi:hypothetical protein
MRYLVAALATVVGLAGLAGTASATSLPPRCPQACPHCQHGSKFKKPDLCPKLGFGHRAGFGQQGQIQWNPYIRSPRDFWMVQP